MAARQRLTGWRLTGWRRLTGSRLSALRPGGSRLGGWLSSRWNRARYERELDDELRAHRDLEIDELIESGVAPEEARARVGRQFGAYAGVVKEESRDAWGWGAWDRLMQDTRAAWRMLRRHRAFTIVAVSSLALGIGANTAIFSLIDAVAFRTLPLPEPDRLVRLERSGTRNRSNSANVALYDAIRTRSDAFASVAMMSSDIYKVRAIAGGSGTDSAVGGRTEPTWGQAVTGTYHTTLRLQPLIGRLLTPADDAGSVPAAVVVLGHGYWQRQFHADPDVLGRTLLINNQPHTIVGVTPPAFVGLETGTVIDVTVPMARPAEDDRETWRSTPIVARLKPDVTAEQASANVDAIFQSFMATTAMTAETRALGWQRLAAIPMPNGLDQLRREFLRPLLVLGSIVVLVLLLACANLAGLLLARGLSRQREMAIRTALGAGRWRIARMLLTESLLLAIAGAAAGVLLAWLGIGALLATLPSDGAATVRIDVTPNLRLLAFTVAVTLAVALLVGLAPAWQLTRRRQQPALTERARTMTVREGRTARAMVIVQVALALVLVFSATMLVRSLRNLRAVDGGFARPGIVLFAVDFDGSGYDYPRLLAFDRDLRARLLQSPGVDFVTSSTITPLSGADETRAILVPGYTPPKPDARVGAHFNHVTAGFLELFQVAMVRGRTLDARDLDARAPDAAVVSERFVRQFFGTAEPLGRTVSTRFEGARTFTIVGVARDMRHDNLRAEPAPTIYVPLSKRPAPPRELRFSMRSAAPEVTMGEARRILQEMDPGLTMIGLKTMEQEVDRRLMRERLLAGLSGLFGTVALLLAAIGVYGLLAYAVSRRTNEIGVRLALGSSRAGVIWAVCRECVLLAAAGVAIGLVATVWAARLLGHALENLLFGVEANDIVTGTVAVLLLVATALAAGALPARRAARVDPLVALRHE